MSESTVSVDLLSALQPRVGKLVTKGRIRSIRDRFASQRLAYSGGLPAEQQSLESARVHVHNQIRAEFFGQVGRRIDLMSLLCQQGADGNPLWALVDPLHTIGWLNGRVSEKGKRVIPDAEVQVGELERSSQVFSLLARFSKPLDESFDPIGLPPLPQRVRELAINQKIRRQAFWVGVLYQPDQWAAVDPDPALIVQWKDRPGEYHALAVWGVDGPAILEFVD